MLPLLTFASGLVAGIVGVRLLKTVKAPGGLKTATGAIAEKARHGLDQTESSLRQATVSGLTAIERSSASLRARLTPEVPVPAEEKKPARRKGRAAATPRTKATAAAPAEVEPAPAPEAKPKRRAKAKAAASETGTAS